MKTRHSVACHRRHNGGFSLVEVVIAMGIFALAILALVGVIGPMLAQSNEEAAEADEARVIEVVRQWFASTDLSTWDEGTRKLDAGGTLEFIVYAWREPNEPAQWRCWRVDSGSERQSAAQDVQDYGNANGTLGSAIFSLRIEEAPEYYPGASNGNTSRPDTYRALHAAVRREPPPEPGTDLASLLDDLDGRAITLQFNLGWRHP